MSKGFICSVCVALSLAGCSAPGFNYHAPAGSGPEPVRADYSVQRITPELLASLRSQSGSADTPRFSPSLDEATKGYVYRVGPHDVLNVIVWNHPELTISQSQSTPIGTLAGSYLLSPPSSQGPGFAVSATGTIYFPYAGTVPVAGKTVDEIRLALQHALEGYSKNPQVDVQVVGFKSQMYQLAGAVDRPGLYSLTNSPLTVSQAIVMAGGGIRSVPTSGSGTLTDLTSLPLADLSRVILISAGKREVLNLRKFYLFGDQTQDRLLHGGDIIQVPSNTDEQVHVIGEVPKQGNYPMSDGVLNLAQALGEAGGLDLSTSDPARIFIFRGGYEKPTVFWLDAHSADAMLLATQFALRPQDVIYVATTRLATWSRVISQILPTVQTLYETKILVHP